MSNPISAPLSGGFVTVSMPSIMRSERHIVQMTTTTTEEGNDSLPVPISSCTFLDTCAICITKYSIGDALVWSSNPECTHAFHEDCIMIWLMKLRRYMLCPCCRQEFILGDYSKDDSLDIEEGSNALSNDLAAISAVSD